MSRSYLENNLKNNFDSNRSKIKEYILNAKDQEVTHVFYGTFDELWCDAGFHISDKKQYANELEAFITLYTFNQTIANSNFYLPTDYPNEIEAEYMINLLNNPKEINFYVECTRRYLYKTISVQELTQELERVIFPIKEHIHKIRIGERSTKEEYESFWGIYENGKKVKDEMRYEFPMRENYISVLALCLDWNDLQFWMETESQYVYFSWSTGA